MQFRKYIKIPLAVIGAFLTTFNTFLINSVGSQEKEIKKAKSSGSLNGHLNTRWNFKGNTQGAGFPNSISAGVFIPFSTKSKSTWFLDADLKSDFADSNGSSIVKGILDENNLSASGRLGYRWLNNKIDKVYGIYGGYDIRTLNIDDNTYTITNRKNISLSQLAFGIEAVNDTWKLNSYALIPNKDSVKRVNSHYEVATIKTIGIDLGKQLTSKINSSLGYYYQSSNLDKSGSGLKGGVAYDLGNGLKIEVNLSHDNLFDTRLSANFNYQFGSRGAFDKKDDLLFNEIQASPVNRSVRVHSRLDIEPTETVGVVDLSGNNLINGLDLSGNNILIPSNNFDISGNFIGAGANLNLLSLNKLTNVDESNNASDFVDLDGITIIV